MWTVKTSIFLVLVSVVALLGYVLGEHVHSPRWHVKTLTDGFAFSGSSRSTTIAEQNLAPRIEVSEEMQRQAGEKELLSLSADLIMVKKELDRDYHLVLKDPNSEATMIAEIPDPSVALTPALRSKYATARAIIDSLIGRTPGFFAYDLEKPARLQLTGVGFFDEDHVVPQHGMARNCRELHPVLSVDTGVSQDN